MHCEGGLAGPEAAFDHDGDRRTGAPLGQQGVIHRLQLLLATDEFVGRRRQLDGPRDRTRVTTLFQRDLVQFAFGRKRRVEVVHDSGQKRAMAVE
jgi:hypothetical protein